MKLWQKIFLYTLMLVMLAVGVTSILVLDGSFRLAMDQKEQAAATEHEFLIANFKSMLLSERFRQNMILLEDGQVLQFMEDIFGAQTMRDGIAFYDGEARLLYENQEMDVPKELLLAVSGSGEARMQIAGESLYIASRETLETKEYYFLTMTDLGDVLSMHRDMLDVVRVGSMVCAVAIAAVLLVVVKLLLLPLQKINEGTRAIAQGDYGRRVPQRGSGEMAELASNMNQMAQAVEQNVKALEAVAEDREQFIANLSHEMKTPLTSILGFADLLLIKGDLTESQRMEYAGIIKEEAKRLRTLSGKLMELITVGEGSVEWAQEEVSHLFGEIAQSLDVVARSKGQRLVFQCEEGLLWMDRELMKSLVYNLADNAMKASREGDEIRLHGWFEQGEFCFSVEDDGVGIPQEEIGKITQAFYMVDKARGRASGGAGLGLALCVEIARLHRGTLAVESDLGRGTKVTVRMKGGLADEVR